MSDPVPRARTTQRTSCRHGSPRDAPTTIGLAALVILGTAVRLGYAVALPIRTDEAFTYNEYAAKSLEGVFSYTFPNNHLLNTLLIHAATARLGMAPWVVRLPALIAGVLLIPATHALVRRLAGRSAALLAAALVAGSSPLIAYSADGRGYTLLALCSTTLAAVAARLADHERLRDWAAFAVLGPLGFFAIPVMLYPYGGVVLWMVLTPGRTVRRDRLALVLVISAAATLLLYLPVLARSGVEALVANRFVAPLPWNRVVRELPATLGRAWLQWNGDLPRPLAIALAGCAVLGLARAIRRRGSGGRMFGLTATVLGWSLGVALLQRVAPYERVWLFLAPLYAGCVACGPDAVVDAVCRQAEGRRLAVGSSLAVAGGLGLVVLSWLGGSIRSDAASQTMNHAEAMVSDLRTILRPHDGVLAASPADASLKYAFLAGGLPVEFLYDYRVRDASRLYLAVDRPSGQTPESVMKAGDIKAPAEVTPRLVRDYGESALYLLER
jgi:hypothetical protein